METSVRPTSQKDLASVPKPSAFLSLAEAAAEIRTPRRFIEMRIADGELTVYRPSRRLVRIRRTDFEIWLESYCTKSGAKSAKIGKVPVSAPSAPTTGQQVEAS